MKKSVILTILVIYIFAIFIVGIIGGKSKVYDETIYVDEIICVSEEFVKYEKEVDGYIGKITKDFKEDLKILIKCQVNPANTPFTALDYSIGGTQICNLTKDNDGNCLLSFIDSGSVTVTISSTDGKSKQVKIKVIVTKIDDILD